MNNILTIPDGIVKHILSRGGTTVFKLLNADKFVDYCKQRDLDVDRDRLLSLERLGLFVPMFRINIEGCKEQIRIPIDYNSSYFEDGTIIDTYGNMGKYHIPDLDNINCQAYYSVFQIDGLYLTLTSLTMRVRLDSYIDPIEAEGIDCCKVVKGWTEYAEGVAETIRGCHHREGIGCLCQYISDIYGPKAQTNKRKMPIPEKGGLYFDQWIEIYDENWDWHSLVRSWNPEGVAMLFSLDSGKLKHAYETLALSQESCDPLAEWYQLVQFISYKERLKLKGEALRAESIRAGCFMIRELYKDLYGDMLPHPNEVYRTIINHFPEIHTRKDVRKYLEYVVNRYDLNPQPKLTLFVEGESEEVSIDIIFREYFGVHPGVCGIEVINLHGVDNATGAKHDRFRAILRLVDYLHMHQTITFLVLDNENNASKLKSSAQKTKSILCRHRYVTRSEYIKIWRNSFEFDNFSATEIATAMNKLAENRIHIKAKDIIECKGCNNSNNILSKMYKDVSGYGLNKVELNKILVNSMLSSKSRRNPNNRPIIKILRRVLHLAIRNPFPIRHESWENNQSSKYLGKKR